MKLFTSSQIRLIDKFTIENEPVAPVDLMERAARGLFQSMMCDFDLSKDKFLIIAGQGNNGGDGLALARIMSRIRITSYNVCYTKLLRNNCITGFIYFIYNFGKLFPNRPG